MKTASHLLCEGICDGEKTDPNHSPLRNLLVTLSYLYSRELCRGGKARDVWSIKHVNHVHNHREKQKYTCDACRTAMEGMQSF